MKMRKMSLGIVLALTTLVSVASAVTVNVDIQLSGSPTYTGTGGAGGGIWNGVAGSNGTPPASGSATNLLDSTGAGTSVDFSFTNADSTGDLGTGDSNSLNALLNDYTFTTGTINFTISDLTNGAYDLYLYGSAGNYQQRSIFTITGVGSQTIGGGSSGATNNGGTGGTVPVGDLGITYVKFAGIIVTGGQITGTVTPNTAVSPYAPFNGFQLVSLVPEPSAFVLTLAGLCALCRVRRK